MRYDVASSDVSFYGHAKGYGLISIYHERQFVQSLSAKELATLYRLAMKEREDEFDQTVRLSSMFHSKIKAGVAVEWIFAMSSFYSRAIQKQHYILMIEQKLGFLEAYRVAIHHFLNNRHHHIEYGSMLGHSVVYEAFLTLNQRLEKRYELFLFKQWTNRVNSDIIVLTEQFHQAYFYQLSHHVRGFIFDQGLNPKVMTAYADQYQIPMITTKQYFKSGDRVMIDGSKQLMMINPSHLEIQSFNRMPLNHKIAQSNRSPVQLYATVSQNHFIHQMTQEERISGICVYRTEYLYHTKGTVPNTEEFMDVFTAIFEKLHNKDIYIALPDIRPDLTIDVLSNHYLDLDLYDAYPVMINHLIEGMAKAMRKTGFIPKIVVPMIRLYKEVNIWTTIIESICEHMNSITPDIGFMMETESALEFHEDFKGLKFAIIGLDNLIEELDDRPNPHQAVTFQHLKTLIWQDLKEMHQFFRSYMHNTKHIVMGKVLSDPLIFSKFLKAGFQEFALPIQDLPKIEPVISQHIATRGRYKGVHEATKQKNQQNLIVSEE